MTRTLEQAWANPEYEVFCELGFENGAKQIGRLDVNGRTTWKTRRIAEKHARDYTDIHGNVAYVSEC